MSGLVPAAALGAVLGVIAGVPVGVINMAITDAVTAGRLRFAIGLGLGGAAADAIQALVAFAGLGHVVTGDPGRVRALAIAAALLIIAYAVFAWRRRARGPRRPPGDEATAGAATGRWPRGMATGFLLTLPNPAALGAWVAVAAATWPDARPAEAGAIAGGVVVGSALWFTTLARWIARIRPDHPAIAWLPRVALLVIIAIALIGVARAL